MSVEAKAPNLRIVTVVYDVDEGTLNVDGGGEANMFEVYGLLKAALDFVEADLQFEPQYTRWPDDGEEEAESA